LREHHVYLLVSLPPTLSIAKAIQLIKASSSKWVPDTFRKDKQFKWQEGYGAFSVNISHIADTVAYIKQQREHYKNRSFQKNILPFLTNMKVYPAMNCRFIF